MSDIIRFQTDGPERVQLKFPEGKEVDGRFGPQVMFSTVDDRLFFVDPPVAAKIHALRLGVGDTIVICKSAITQGRKKSLSWEITRHQEIAVTPKPVVATPAPAVSPAVAGEASTAHKGSIMTRTLASALIASIDGLILARDYARGKGLQSDLVLDFNAEDARTLANAALIQMQREQENALKYRTNGNSNGYVNGGASWPKQ